MKRFLLILVALTIPGLALAADSVVLGRGISNSFFSKVACPENTICRDSQYVWVLKARRTLAGPPVKGTVRGLIMQHSAATPDLVSSTELFVLRPIEDSALRASSGATFYILSLAPKGIDGQYCLDINPATVGLNLEPPVAPDQFGFYCFDSRQLQNMGV